MAPSHLVKALQGPLAVATEKEAIKRAKYHDMAEQNAASFYALSVETLGGLSPNAQEFVKLVANFAAGPIVVGPDLRSSMAS